ncbi:MAG TPA: hypothetical protein VF263_09170 [Longimicrobiaceae bacterium]
MDHALPAPAGTEAYGIVILPPAPAAGVETRPALPLRALLARARGGAVPAGG